MSSTTTDIKRRGMIIPEPVIREQMLKAGDLLGHCRVVELIAAGGMANVYKVWHEQLEVVRALKILKPGFSDEARGRLETEAKISANLRHENIVEIYGMGYWNTIPYIEMEYIDGPSLKEFIDKYRNLPVPFSLAVAHFVCIALDFAFKCDMTLYGKVYDGLIHRDIKPANILISSQGKIKLADFGIARPSEVSLHTVGSKVMGTFAYLSPEQLNGEKLDQRSDVYAMGTVLYEMISGKKTFPQKHLSELVQKKAKGHFVPLNSLDLEIPRQLCTVIDKSLSLDKNKRHPDAGDLDIEIMAILQKITGKAPGCITKELIKNPHSATVQIAKNQKGYRLIITTILTALFISLSCGYYLYSRGVLFNLKKSKTIAQPTPGSNLQITISDDDIFIPVKDTAPVTKTVRPPAKAFTNGTAAYNSKDFVQAITYFESVEPGSLTNRQRSAMYLMLAKAYISENQIEDAVKIAESPNISNELKHLLSGEIFFKQKQFDRALEDLNQITSFSTSNVKQIDVLLLKASILESRFNLKPNRDNKNLCRETWASILTLNCREDTTSALCKDAQKKIQLFSNSQ